MKHDNIGKAIKDTTASMNGLIEAFNALTESLHLLGHDLSGSGYWQLVDRTWLCAECGIKFDNVAPKTNKVAVDALTLVNKATAEALTEALSDLAKGQG